jgi:thioesterase domain-containing protein
LAPGRRRLAEIGARSAEIGGDWRQVGGSASRWRRSAGGAAAELLQYGREDTAERRDEERRPGAHSSHLRVESQRAKLLARERALRTWHVSPWPFHVACIPVRHAPKGIQRSRTIQLEPGGGGRSTWIHGTSYTRGRGARRTVSREPAVAALYELFTSSRADRLRGRGRSTLRP